MKGWLNARWTEVSTKLGLILGAISTAAPIFAPYDKRIAWAGLIVAGILVICPEKKNSQPS